MNNQEIKNIIYDLNPKNCLSKFQNTSPRYAFELVVICYGITILISVFTQDLPSVSFHKEVLFEIPINIFNSTILNPILEEILFFGIPISLVNNPIVILVVGIMWTIFHLFAPMNVETYSLSLNAFIATLPVLFICDQFATCSQFNNNNFDFPEFHIFLGVTVLSVVLVYFLQRRKEEKEYVKKILRKKHN
jgi:hypothetical protein